jgi:hypothetical protein
MDEMDEGKNIVEFWHYVPSIENHYAKAIKLKSSITLCF